MKLKEKILRKLFYSKYMSDIRNGYEKSIITTFEINKILSTYTNISLQTTDTLLEVCYKLSTIWEYLDESQTKEISKTIAGDEPNSDGL